MVFLNIAVVILDFINKNKQLTLPNNMTFSECSHTRVESTKGT